MEGGIQSGMPWVGGTAPILGDGWVQFGGPDSAKVFWDKLSKADQDLIIQYLLSAQNPVLIPPQTIFLSSSNDYSVSGVSATQVALQMEETRHKIIIGMLDGWLKSIQEQADRSKKEDEKRAIEGLSIAYHTYRHEVDLQADSNFPLFAVGMIIVGTGIHQMMLPSSNMGGVDFNPVVDMYAKTIMPMMGDMRAELGLIGAIYAAGIQYFTLAQIASESVGKNARPKDGEFAKGYAENVVKLIGDPQFNAYLLAIVARGVPQGESLVKERLREQCAMVKVVLLSSALAMLYKSEAGKMTSLEFAAMLKGEIKFQDGDIRATLVALIRENLDEISPALKEVILGALLEYFDSDPAIEALGDPAKVFAGIYGTLPRGDLAG